MIESKVTNVVYRRLFFKNRKSVSFSKICLVLCLVLFSLQNGHTEGTAQLAPKTANRANLIINNPSYNSFCQYDGTDDQRLYFHIADPNVEQVFFGFSQPGNSPAYPCGGSASNGYVRIKDPSGTIVWPTPGSANGQLIGGTNLIANQAQAIAGPNQIVGATGYNAFNFVPSGLAAGDYYIEISSNISSNGLNLGIPWWDITVATTAASPVAISGRVFSKNWALASVSNTCSSPAPYGGFHNPFEGTFYALSPTDSMVVEISFDGAGFRPLWFNMFFNQTGTGTTSDVCMDRQSQPGTLSGTPLYPIFLNDPDNTVYPSGTVGIYAVQPVIVGCNQGTTCIIVEVTKEGLLEVVIDLDPASGAYLYDPGTRDVVIALKVEPALGEILPYRRCVLWDGNDGLGNPVDLTMPLPVSVKYTQGIYHLPLFDAEYMTGGITPVTVRPTPPSGNPGTLYYDDTLIPFTSGVSEPTTEINGCVAPCHTWTNFDFGNSNTINTWFYAAEEIFLTATIPDCTLQAINDTVSTAGTTPIVVGVMANDFGAANVDTSLVTTVGVLQPIGGSLSINSAMGEVTYTPDGTFAGIDSFEYVICYKLIPTDALCDTAKVQITVANQPPVALDDSVDATMDVSNLPIDVLNEGTPDSDPNSDVLSIIGAGTDAVNLMTAQGGTLSINDNGTPGNTADDFIDYTPLAGFYGADTFQYEISDGNGGTDIATVILNVLATSEAVNCTDGMDNDGDGLIDCNDPDCLLNISTPLYRGN